jgi:Ca2+-binding EF-hand superfamily protein
LGIAAKLPVSREQDDVDKRDKMFDEVDQNGSGRISLAELDLGVKNFLGEEIFLMKPAMKEAFKASKGVGK